jgi:hypothetical protein
MRRIAIIPEMLIAASRHRGIAARGFPGRVFWNRLRVGKRRAAAR